MHPKLATWLQQCLYIVYVERERSVGSTAPHTAYALPEQNNKSIAQKEYAVNLLENGNKVLKLLIVLKASFY